MHLPIVLLVVVVFLVPAISCQGPPPNNCERSCGNVSIPFPFGLEERCAYNSSFLVTCETGGGLRIRSGYDIFYIAYINTATSEIQAMAMVATDCTNSSDPENMSTVRFMSDVPFSISRKNRYVAVGCNKASDLSGSTNSPDDRLNYWSTDTTCESVCNYDSMRNGSCSAGNGCCEAKLPKGLTAFTVSAYPPLIVNTSVLKTNPCGYAFVVEQGKYEFSTTDLLDFQGTTRNYPMTWLLDWAIGNDTCDTVDKDSDAFSCKGDHQECVQDYDGPGYQCRCKQGYAGNPYIKDNCTSEQVNGRRI